MKQFAYCSRFLDVALVIRAAYVGFRWKRIPSRYIRAYSVSFGFGTALVCVFPPR